MMDCQQIVIGVLIGFGAFAICLIAFTIYARKG